MTAVAIIPAKGTSMRIPHKNIKPFHGKPIIAYSIATAQASGLFGRIIVSTDSPEVAEVAEASGTQVIWRERYLCRDKVGTQEVTAYAAMDIRADYVCCIYATAPLMSADDLKRGYHDCLENQRGGFAFAVGTEPLCDAGQFYWGRKESFLRGAPLISPDTVMVPIAPERVCDINTLNDWRRAETMFAALREEEQP